MLGKLIGYEMKAYSRIMVPIFIAVAALSVIIGLGLRFIPEWVGGNVLFALTLILYIGLLVAIAVMTTILGINRYYGNLLGREGYFMFSLPVKTSTMMLAKTIGALIWTVLGAIVGGASIALISVIGFNTKDYAEIINAFKMLLTEIKPYTGYFILWVIVIIMAVIQLIVQVYAAVSIGSQWSGHRLIGSILVYIGFEIIEAIIATIIRAIHPLANWIERVMTGTPYPGTTPNYGAPILILVLILVEIVIFWVIAWYFTDRKLNLE